MTESSPRLALPYLQPSQAQKHVTHNEALLRLDAIVQLAIDARGAEIPPSVPNSGAVFALGPNPQNAWASHPGELAVWDGVAWRFMQPTEGWRGYDKSAGTSIVFENGSWQNEEPNLQNVSGLGIGTSSDAVNKLSVSSDASLLNHDGQGHQLKINKFDEDQTASLLFQSGWTGHAELGLAGDNTFSLKVSADGGNWQDVFRAGPGMALIDVPVGGSAVQSDPLDTSIGRLLTTGAFGLGKAAAPVPSNDLDAILATGSYLMSAGVIATSNLPNGAVGQGSNLLHIQQNLSDAVQVMFSDAGGRTFLRSKEAGIWQDWQELYSQAEGSLLGPVSFVGTRPSGAVIERGENANGSYVRWADGTQICSYRNTALQDLGQSQTLDQTWDYPKPFAQGSGASVALNLQVERPGWATGSIPAICMATYVDDCTESQAGFALTNLNTVSTFSYGLTAIGRWA